MFPWPEQNNIRVKPRHQSIRLVAEGVLWSKRARKALLYLLFLEQELPEVANDKADLNPLLPDRGKVRPVRNDFDRP